MKGISTEGGIIRVFFRKEMQKNAWSYWKWGKKDSDYPKYFFFFH